MMYCKNCGTENDDATKFCVNCGAQMDKTAGTAMERKNSAASGAEYPKLSKRTKSIILIIVIVLGLAAVFYKIGSGLMSPERMVSKYINAQAEGSYGELYGMLDMPDGEFTSKNQFVDTLERSSEGTEKGNIGNITVTEASATDLSNISKYHLDRVYDKAYRVTYDLQGGGQEQKLVFLSMQKGILFDKYKIMPAEYLAREYTVYAPPYITVAFDNTELDGSYEYTAAQNRYYEDEKCYKLNNVFSGEHVITLSAPFADDTEISAEVAEDSYIECSGRLKIRQEIKDEMQKIAEDTLKIVFDAAVAEKDFWEIVSQLKIAEGQDDMVKEGYEAFSNRSWSGYDNDTVIYNKLEFAGIKPSTSESYRMQNNVDAPLSYEAGFSVVCDVTAAQGYILIGNRHTEKTLTFNVEFSYENDELSIYSIGKGY